MAPPRKRRRPSGDGTVYHRSDGMWVCRIQVGYRPDGKPLMRSVSSKNYKLCLEKRDRLRAEIGLDIVPEVGAGRETIAAFARRWLESLEGTMDQTSLQRHRDNLKLRIIPRLGRQRLTDLTVPRLVDFLRQVRTTPLPPKRKTDTVGLLPSPRSVRYTYATLRQMFQAAVTWRVVSSNPVTSVAPPQVPRVETRTPRPDEVVRFLASAEAEGDPLLPFYVVAIYSGLRRGELLGLCWDDVDFEANAIRTRRALESVKGGAPVFADLKTAKSRRRVSLPPEAMAMLARLRERQAEQKRVRGPGYASHDLVFVTATGTPYDPDNVTKHTKRAYARAGLDPAFTLHGLRHGSATLMLASGVAAKMVSERLGHSSTAFTLDRYVHAIQSLDVEAANSMQAVLDKIRKGDEDGRSTPEVPERESNPE